MKFVEIDGDDWELAEFSRLICDPVLSRDIVVLLEPIITHEFRGGTHFRICFH
jgi:hypothetical protein